MPYTIEYIERDRGIIVYWTGVVTGPELIKSYRERFSDIERIKTLRYVITDNSQITDYNVSENDIFTICRITNDAAAGYNSNVYAAAIMPTDISYGMARMAEAYTNKDKTGWQTFVSRSREDVEKWLLSNLGNDLTFKN